MTSKKRALVVEDEEPLLRLQVTFLSKLGVEARGVPSGEEAIRYLEKEEADLVVSDVRMPGAVDGVQLYEWVAANRPQLASRFLFASGDLVGLELGDFFARTGVACIAKPFRYAAYAEAVRKVLEPDGSPR